MSDLVRPQGLQHVRLPFPLLSPIVCSNSYPLSRWCHPNISSSAAPFSFCLQSFPTSESLTMSWLFTSGGPSIGASPSASVLSMNIQGWFPLGLTADSHWLSTARHYSSWETCHVTLVEGLLKGLLHRQAELSSTALLCKVFLCMASHFSCVQLFATSWTVIHQIPLWRILQARILEWVSIPSPPGDLSDPGMELASLTSPALSGGFFTTSTTWEAEVLLLLPLVLSSFFPSSLRLRPASWSDGSPCLYLPIFSQSHFT